RPYRPPPRNSPDSTRFSSVGSAQTEWSSSNAAEPGPQRAPLTAVSAAGGPTPEPQPAGPTRADQIKTILAGIGILAVLFHGLRLLGLAAQS
ncbi:MAG: hypothetical protein ACYSWU_28920, partial [Planctomycetota bacterium]